MRGTRVGIAAVAVVVLVSFASPGRQMPLLERALRVGVGALLVLTFGWWSQRTGRHTPWSTASTAADDGAVVVLWKPGCPYCERLMLSFGRARGIVWVNVWKDDDANRVVRELNSGDEFVPTVLVAGEVLRNPSVQVMRERLAEAAP